MTNVSNAKCGNNDEFYWIFAKELENYQYFESHCLNHIDKQIKSWHEKCACNKIQGMEWAKTADWCT